MTAGPGIVRREPQGLPILLDRLVQSPLRRVGVAQVVVGFDAARGRVATLSCELVDRLSGLALLAQGRAKVRVGVGMVRIEPQRLLKLVDRLGEPSLPA